MTINTIDDAVKVYNENRATHWKQPAWNELDDAEKAARLKECIATYECHGCGKKKKVKLDHDPNCVGEK